ncbi:MAG: ATP synthase F1 subunit gamma [Patescibacteria group bacterium]
MNLRSVRKKIKSVKNVKKITKAMQLMSAVKMKKAVAQEVEGRPFRDGLYEILNKVSSSVDPSLSPLFQYQADENSSDLIIFVSANKGLCGAFHLNLLKYILKNVNLEKSEFVSVGSKGSQAITRFDHDLIADFSSNNPINEVSAIFDMVLNAFYSKKYRHIKLLYTKYFSTTKSEVKLVDILPVPKITLQQADPSGHSLQAERTEGYRAANKDVIIEPEPKALIEALLKSYVEEQIRGALISSLAVEHSARMLAMKNATDNAEDVIYSLTLVGNKIRQTKITSELLDMVTAKESVETN